VTRAALVAAMLAVLVSACGLRTAVRPPEDTAPVITGAVTSRRDGSAVVVHWNRAERSVDGARLDDLAAFAVERRRDGEGSWQRIAKIDVVDQEKIRRRRDFSYRDEEAGHADADYRVIAICADGQEGPPADATAKAEPDAIAAPSAPTPLP
jgi:hypothetical protein